MELLLVYVKLFEKWISIYTIQLSVCWGLLSKIQLNITYNEYFIEK